MNFTLRYLFSLCIACMVCACQPSDPTASEVAPSGTNPGASAAKAGDGSSQGSGANTVTAKTNPSSPDAAGTQGIGTQGMGTQGTGTQAAGTQAAGAGTRAEDIRKEMQAGERPDRYQPQGRVGDPTQKPGMKTTGSGLSYAVLSPGTGPAPLPGSQVKLHLTCWQQEGNAVGAEFWNSRDDRAAHSYRLDKGDLIEGLVEAIGEMKAGERRWVVIPSALGYGQRGYGALVPPNTNLIVDVELESFSSRNPKGL